ncbi:MAG: uroporphyrinogen-III C-methyltransferase [Halomonas subglaciescola]|nr:uroporphyrinogen-III C-methyltransferase [Halomonas subglaciescola]
MTQHPTDQDDARKADADAKRDDVTQDTTPAGPTPEAEAKSNANGGANRSRRHGKGGNKAKGSAPAQAAPVDSASSAKPAGKNAGGTPPDSVGKPPNNAGKSPKNADKSPQNGGKSPVGGGKPEGGGKPPKSGGKGGIIAIVLVLIVALVLALLAWQGWQRLENQQQRLDALTEQTRDNASQQAVSQLETRMESGEKDRDQALDETLDSLHSEFSDYRQSVDSTLDKVLTQLSQEQDTDERDWLHAEAAYLLRLANQRLRFEGDVKGAAALLQSADDRLADADNPALTPVRRAIASELAALDAVPEVDRTGLYLAFDAQQERIQTLHLDQDVEAEEVEPGMDEAPSGTFQRQLARFGDELKDLVVVRKHDEGLETLVTPEQEAYLRQSLRLIIEQSQIALLKQEQELYDASIDDALELLNGYYDTERTDTQSVISRLKELKDTRITPELPDISGSQQALAEFIDKRFEKRREGGGDA